MAFGGPAAASWEVVRLGAVTAARLQGRGGLSWWVMSTHVYTSSTTCYIPKARVLAHSVKRLHPEFLFHLVLADEPPEGFRLEQEPFDSVITIGDLEIPNLESWIFKHSLVELCTAVKGPALVKLLSRADCSEALYFDPDIVVLAPLNRLLSEFTTASILLTPHLTEPETSLDGIRDNEFAALRHGIYNLGFLGVKGNEAGRRFARWWADRLLKFCYDDIPNGLFTDQRWVDFGPAFFPECRIVRDPVYNAATWNLSHRIVEGGLRDGLKVNGQPLVFYHFSGFDSGAQGAMLEKYGKGMRGLYELREWYIAECDRMGQQELSKVPWRYARFDNGELISEEQRRFYRQREDLQRAFPNPFSTGDVNRSYYHWFAVNYELEAHPQPQVVASEQQGSPSARRFSVTCPEYRIFLVAKREEAAFLGDAARKLLERSYRKEELYIVAPEDVGRNALRNPDLQKAFRLLPASAEMQVDGAFNMISRRFQDRDFLLVTASTCVPSYWDIRLAWSALYREGIATASPLCLERDFRGIHFDDGNATPATSEKAVELADRICCDSSSRMGMEVDRFFPHCFYVRAEALREARALSGNMEGDGLFGTRQFLDRTNKLRYAHALADHVCVGNPAWKDGSDAEALESAMPRENEATLADLRRQAVRKIATGAAVSLPRVEEKMRPRHLHIMHSWGGGLERWVQAYCRADKYHTNLVLKSVGTWGGFGKELHLYRHIDDAAPAKIWRLTPPIKGTTVEYAAYDEILAAIINDFGIEAIVVSSLVGHSLEALRADPPTLMVCHDYYPFCPAFNVCFDSVCVKCGEGELIRCTAGNPHHRFFRNLPPSHWLQLRQAFIRRVKENRVTLIAPTPSVEKNYVRLAPGLEGHFRVIPHGTPPIPGAPLQLQTDRNRPLRVVVLGSLAPHKGLALFEQVREQLVEFAEVYLVGCGAYGQGFAGNRITVIEEYEWEQLPIIIGEIRPDVGLLLSVVPETFSYSLQELFDLGVPPLATNVGSFADRIEHGANGFLCKPLAADVIRSLRELDRDRTALARVQERLRKIHRRTVDDMVDDYRKLFGPEQLSAPAYFCPDARPADSKAPEVARAQVYWRSANSVFSEEHSAGAWFALTPKRQTVCLPIPAVENPLEEIRLDFANRPGFLFLRSLRLYDAAHHLVWNWERSAGVVSGWPRHEIWVVGEADDLGVLLALTGDDPQVILPLEAGVLSALTAGGSIEMECSWPGWKECASVLVSALLQNHGFGATQEGVSTLAKQLEAQGKGADKMGLFRRGEQLEQLARELAEAKARVADIESSWSWRLSRPLRAAAEVAFRFVRAARGS